MRITRNFDVKSYYPHLMTICGYTSRNIPNPQIYADMLERRMRAKESGDKTTANALKLVANTTYGAMLNQYNDLYDPLMGRSVCITGQLFLLELANHLRADCKTLIVVQLNTDGIMVNFDDSEYSKVLEIIKEWEQRTGFELEEDKIKAIIQKDVNNYIEIPYEGKPKIKGGYLVRGIAPAGAFNINNNATIIAKAIIDYFVKDIPVEDTINNCTDIFEFQIIAKAGSKFRDAYHIVDGKQIPVQKVNRVYATSDTRYGKLVKIHADTDSHHNIESLPEHCIIDNNNELTIDDIDKSFYIELARKRVNDYLGIKPEKKTKKKKGELKNMANTNLNVYQKLLLARTKFLSANTKKSGKNLALEFKYFELEDIVPTITKIFNEVGLISHVSFDTDAAYMVILNIDNPDEKGIVTSIPLVRLATNKGTNEVQAFGSTITYYRRYLYFVALDIVEADGFDSGLYDVEEDSTPVEKPKTTKKAKTTVVEQPKEDVPVTPAPKAEEKPLTSADSQATELQIKQLKEVLGKYRDGSAERDKVVTDVVLRTKSFTEISKADCEKLIIAFNQQINGGN